jgi:uncharacterized protein
MLYALMCTDKPDSLELRMKVRPEHLAYLNGPSVTLKAAGPFLDDAGNPTGSLVIIEAEGMAAAKLVAANDPYNMAGLFSHVEIKAWRWALKNPDVA